MNASPDPGCGDAGGLVDAARPADLEADVNAAPSDLPDRYCVRIAFGSGCWEWRGGKYGNGYGAAKLNGQQTTAHRVVYQVLVGEIPAGLDLDHLCRNRACVNPDHLEPVTRRENIRRGTGPFAERARQTHCKRGHEFTPENTYIRSNGTRRCRACAVSQRRERYWAEFNRLRDLKNRLEADDE